MAHESAAFPAHNSDFVVEAGGDHKKKAISNPYIHRLQRRHFLLFDVLPFFGMAAAVAFLWVHSFGVTELALLFGMWLFTGIGVTVGYHRLFTHRTFKAAPWVAAMLAILGSMAGQGGMVSWVALHRRHHECSDQEGDPHSPNLSGGGLKGRLRGLVHSHFLWMRRHEYPNIVHYAPDLLKNRPLIRVARLYYYWVVLGLLLPGVVGGLVYWSWSGAVSGLLWGGLARIFILEHIVWAINSLLHMFGTRPYDSRENSRNGGGLRPADPGRVLAQQPPRVPRVALLRAGLVPPRSGLLGYPTARRLRSRVGPQAAQQGSPGSQTFHSSCRLHQCCSVRKPQMTTSSETANATQDEITEWCRQAVANLLEIRVEDVDPAADFDRLGLDSALAVSLLIDIEERYGVDLPPEALFENPTLNAVTAYLLTAMQQQQRGS